MFGKKQEGNRREISSKTKQKKSSFEKFLKMTGVEKDYNVAIKLYSQYTKEKGKSNPNTQKLTELKEKCLKNATVASETFNRFYLTYQKVNEETKTAMEKLTNPPIMEDTTSYLNTILRYYNEMCNMINTLTEITIPKQEIPSITEQKVV